MTVVLEGLSEFKTSGTRGGRAGMPDGEAQLREEAKGMETEAKGRAS